MSSKEKKPEKIWCSKCGFELVKWPPEDSYFKLGDPLKFPPEGAAVVNVTIKPLHWLTNRVECPSIPEMIERLHQRVTELEEM